MSKKCNKCNKSKGINEFTKEALSVDKHHHSCKLCVKITKCIKKARKEELVNYHLFLNKAA